MSSTDQDKLAAAESVPASSVETNSDISEILDTWADKLSARLFTDSSFSEKMIRESQDTSKPKVQHLVKRLVRQQLESDLSGKSREIGTESSVRTIDRESLVLLSDDSRTGKG